MDEELSPPLDGVPFELLVGDPSVEVAPLLLDVLAEISLVEVESEVPEEPARVLVLFKASAVVLMLVSVLAIEIEVVVVELSSGEFVVLEDPSVVLDKLAESDVV